MPAPLRDATRRTRLTVGLRHDFRLALLRIARERKRALLASSAIIFGMVALVLAEGFIDWNYWYYRESTIRAHLGHIQITRSGFRDNGVADPYRYVMRDDSARLAEIRSTEGVRLVAPRISFSGLVSRGDSTASFIGEGVDPIAERELSNNLMIVDGGALSSDTANEVILGEGLAASIGARVGDRVVLLVTTASGGVNGVEVVVKGLFASVSKAFDDTALRVPIKLAAQVLRMSGAHTWVVLLERTDLTPSVARSLQLKLPPADFEVTAWTALADFYNKSSALLAKQMMVMRAIIALIIVLSISNALRMSVLERTSEIGTAMAIGTPRYLVLRRFLVEGIVLGAAGGAVGLVLAAATAYTISKIGIPNPPPPGMTRGFIGEIMVTPKLLLTALAIALSTTLLASVYPAWRASRLLIVDALRHNH